MDGTIFIMVWSTSWILLRKKLQLWWVQLPSDRIWLFYLRKQDLGTDSARKWVEVAQMDRENRRVRASCKLFVAAVVTSLRLQNTGKRSMSTRKRCSRKGTREHLVEDEEPFWALPKSIFGSKKESVCTEVDPSHVVAFTWCGQARTISGFCGFVWNHF